MKYLQLLIFVFFTSSCSSYKVFYTSRTSFDNYELKVFGRSSNKLYKDQRKYFTVNPNILKTSYKEKIRDILLENLPNDFDYEKLNYSQDIYVTMFFDSQNLRPKEVYFVMVDTDIFSVFPKETIKKIEREVKRSIVAEKNISWWGEQEVETQLNSTRYVQHSMGFRIKQLFLLKNNLLSADKLLYL